MNEETSDQGFSANIGPIISVATAIGFLCSLIYNYGYFYGFSVDVRILSLNDILSSFTLWAPILISIAIGYLASKIIKPHHKNVFDAINTKGGVGKVVMWLIFWLLAADLLLYIATATSIFYKIFGTVYPLFIYFSSFVIWIMLTLYIGSHHKFKQRINELYLNTITYVIFIFATMFVTGITASSEQSMLHKSNISVYMNNKEIENRFILLRYLEQGLLVKETEQNSYVLITWDEINKVVLVPTKPFHGFLRNYLKLPSIFDTDSTHTP